MTTLIYLTILYCALCAIDRCKKFINMANYVTIDQVAERLGVNRRTVNSWLAQNKKIPFIQSYEKFNPGVKNSPFIIIPNKDFFDRRKRFTPKRPGRQPGAKEGIDFNIITRTKKK